MHNWFKCFLHMYAAERISSTALANIFKNLIPNFEKYFYFY